MKRKPTRVALHRLLSVDTDLHQAECNLAIAMKKDPKALAELGITDLGEIRARLAEHLKTIRAHARSMFPEIYPQQPEAGK